MIYNLSVRKKGINDEKEKNQFLFKSNYLYSNTLYTNTIHIKVLVLLQSQLKYTMIINLSALNFDSLLLI